MKEEENKTLSTEFADSLFTDTDFSDSNFVDTSVSEKEGLFVQENASEQFDAEEQLYRQVYEHQQQQQNTVSDAVVLPFLGAKTAKEHTSTLLKLLAFFAVSATCLAVYGLGTRDIKHEHSYTAAKVQVSAVQLQQNIAQAKQGDVPSFAAMRKSYENLNESLNELESGGGVFSFLAPSSVAADAKKVKNTLGADLGKNVELIASRQEALVVWNKTNLDASQDLDTISAQAQELKKSLTKRAASVAQTMALGDLAMLAERTHKDLKNVLAASAQPAVTSAAIDESLVAMEALLDTASGRSDSGGEAYLPEAERAMLSQIRTAFTQLKGKGHVLAELVQDVDSADEASTRIYANMTRANPEIATLYQSLSDEEHDHLVPTLVMIAAVVAGLLTLLTAFSLMRVQLADTRRLQQRAEQEQLRAEEENNRNQTAILRLMDELQNVSEGDLTQEATVTEDITGAIADSINSTVEELRALVGSVQEAADKVTQTTADVELTSSVLLDASTEQLHEIQSTGESVLNMAERINHVSAQAQESARVAQHSRQAAEKGFRAVQNSIDGMNIIRDQIQDTAKRIKRLGESSQEIGEITELISDITEQTNVLALNAAIQAASAGEAGRGFSVVAEEVQRLAERSAEATKQISALVKTIQTDTHDAVAAMERSTQGVVQGANLSDNAGQALAEIDQVSRQLADLIQKISASADEEAKQASEVADHIQQIFVVTENTTEGTRTTSQQVSQLTKVAQELRSSVERFKIK